MGGEPFVKKIITTIFLIMGPGRPYSRNDNQKSLKYKVQGALPKHLQPQFYFIRKLSKVHGSRKGREEI